MTGGRAPGSTGSRGGVRPGVRILRYRVPLALKLILLALGAALALLVLPGLGDPAHWSGIATVAPILLGLMAVFWFNNTGYRVGYDDDALYGRMMGLTRRLRWPDWRRIAWDEIERLEGRSQGDTPALTPLLPWQYLAVVPRGDPGEACEIWIYAESLAEPDLAEVLATLVTRRPDLALPEIVEPLRERGHLPAAA